MQLPKSILIRRESNSIAMACRFKIARENSTFGYVKSNVVIDALRGIPYKTAVLWQHAARGARGARDARDGDVPAFPIPLQ